MRREYYDNILLSKDSFKKLAHLFKHYLLFTLLISWKDLTGKSENTQKNKGAFTSENALVKLIHCACQQIVEK